MGVMATYCQLCGLPVQHDHYYPYYTMLGIYRGEPELPRHSKVKLEAKHAWLKDAVGLRCSEKQQPIIIEGAVHDGYFEVACDDNGVMDGVDDRAALHRYCYTTLGEPSIWDLPPRDLEEGELAPYVGQLFEFQRLQDDGLDWMLVDPGTSTEDGLKSRERIAALAEELRAELSGG